MYTRNTKQRNYSGQYLQVKYIIPKTKAQQDMQSIHCVRSELIKQCTATTNQPHGFLAEDSMVLGHQVQVLSRSLPDIRKHLAQTPRLLRHGWLVGD